MSRRALVLLGLVALAAPAATAAEDPAADPPPAAGAVASVAVRDDDVRPAELVVAPGGQVVWVNVGIKRHTVTADAGAFDSGTMLPGERFRVVAPGQPGRLEYHCRFHTYIRGALTVSPVDLRAPGGVAYAARATLSGSVPGGAAGTPVVIERQGARGWAPLVGTALRADGSFSARTPALRRTARLRAHSGDLVSPTAVVEARTRLAARRVGRRLIEARAAPSRRGLAARLERLDLDRYLWLPVASGRIGAGGRARLRAPGPGVYRVRLPRGVPGVAGAVSGAVPLR